MLRNLLLAWAPFDNAAYCVVARAESGCAWAWDRSRIAMLLAASAAPATAELIPEALLVPRVPNDGARLVQALEGVDAQVWQGGELVSSRWWPETPSLEDWARWWRTTVVDSGHDSEQRLPVVQNLAWGRPWAHGVGLDELLSSSSRIERVALGAAVVGLVGLTSAQLHQAWQAFDERRTRVAERDRLAALAGPVVGARDRALSLAGEVAALSSRMSAPQPLEVLQHLAERLPADGVTLRELELTGPRLRIALDVAPTLPRTTIVRDLQAAGWFVQINEVRDASGRGWIGFEMQIQGTRPPPNGTAGVSGARPSNSPEPIGPAAPASPGGNLAFPLPTAPVPGPSGVRP